MSSVRSWQSAPLSVAPILRPIGTARQAAVAYDHSGPKACPMAPLREISTMTRACEIPGTRAFEGGLWRLGALEVGAATAEYRPSHEQNHDSRHRRPHRARQAQGCAGRALSRLRALHHHAPGAARRARRPEARAPAHPLRHARAAARPGRRLPEVRQDRRRDDGQLPPARQPGDLRRACPPGAGLRGALSAGRRPGQLRQHRRR